MAADLIPQEEVHEPVQEVLPRDESDPQADARAEFARAFAQNQRGRTRIVKVGPWAILPLLLLLAIVVAIALALAFGLLLIGLPVLLLLTVTAIASALWRKRFGRHKK